jgi:hypothetical protein
MTDTMTSQNIDLSSWDILDISTLAKQSFLSHSHPDKILPNLLVKLDHEVLTSLDFATLIF